MKYIVPVLLIVSTLFGCQNAAKQPIHPVNWESRIASIPLQDSVFGRTYLPVYSQIYQMHENKTYDLTVTVSIRNTSSMDTLYLQRADYYGTQGRLVRKYLTHAIYLKPLETIEIVIYENDNAGGSGGHFLFDWAARKRSEAPLTEAVMISTSGQQGLSFLTRGVAVERP